MKLLVIIPAYNEVNTIDKIIKHVKGVRLKDIEKEIIVVDDFLRDGIKEKLKK